jgi:glycerol 3-phosphatase-2
VAIRRGVPWVATNLDATVPSARGPLPGNGALVASLRLATGVEPVSTGKPDPTMHRESVLRSGAQRPIVVGDRLDTDIEGANVVGCASLLVLTGVSTARDLLQAPTELRPAFVSYDVSGVLDVHNAAELDGPTATCGAWRARRDGTDGRGLLLESAAPDAADGRRDALDGLRAMCALAWQDAPDGPLDPGSRRGDVGVRAADAAAEQLVSTLGLTK